MQSDNIMINRRVLFDGGMGTQLAARGLTGACPEMNLVTGYDKVVAIHADYVAAGATVISANTFGANAVKLSRHGLEARAAELTSLGIKAARQAAGDRALVALDMGPTGALLEPFGELTFERAYAAYREQAEAGKAAGAGLAMIETMTSIAEAKIAALAARDAGLPFILSFTFEQNGRTLMGDTPQACAVTAAALSPLMLSTNCSGGPEQMLPIINSYYACTALPLLCQPNAGLPQIINGETIFPYGAADMVEPMRALIRAGADGIGGCCGTTPAHIAEFAKLDFGFKPHPARETMICSSRETVAVSLLKDIPELPLDEAEDFDGDAPALTVDISGNSAADACELLASVCTIIHTPLIFKGGDASVMEAVLRHYAGAAGVTGYDALAASTGSIVIV